MNTSTDLTTARGYAARFWELVAEKQDSRCPMHDALQLVESELYERHGLRRYTSYGSFSAAKSRRQGGIRLRAV